VSEPLVTIITPTTGNGCLRRLCTSLDRQTVPWVHILLWDDKREDEYLYPDGELKIKDPHDISTERDDCIRYSVVIPGNMIKGQAAGSALRAIGLMAANTQYVTFADTDVWFDENHLGSLLENVRGKVWAHCIRRIFSPMNECIGEDRFESVGEDSKLSYKLIDNNSMIVQREFGVSASPLYRETADYNDDRLMYAFLKQYAGEGGKTNMVTVNQICPVRLEQMFRQYCTPCKETGKDISDLWRD
jgi:hypothetical protein